MSQNLDCLQSSRVVGVRCTETFSNNCFLIPAGYALHDLQLCVVYDLYIVGREQPIVALGAQSLPPARVYLVYVRDNLARVKGYLSFI